MLKMSVSLLHFFLYKTQIQGIQKTSTQTKQEPQLNKTKYRKPKPQLNKTKNHSMTETLKQNTSTATHKVN
jgi:hypothetical protein